MSWHAALVIAVLSALAIFAPRAATAEAFFQIEVPDAFPEAQPLANTIARDVARTPYFGERPVDSGADAFAAQGEGALYVWWAEGAPADDPAEAIRAALDRVRRTPTEASPQAGSVAIDAWDEALDGGVAEAELTWRHLSNETQTMARALAFTDAQSTPRIVVAECVLHQSRVADVEPTCASALASLTLAVPGEAVAALDELPKSEVADDREVAAAVPELAIAAGDTDDEAHPSGASVDAPRLDAPQEGVLYERRDAPRRDGDGPPWLLILGALLVAGAVYVTLKGRASSDRDGDRGRSDAGDRDDSDDEHSEANGAPDPDDGDGDPDDDHGDDDDPKN